MGPDITFEVGGSSIPPGFSHPRPDHDDVSVRLAMHLAEEQFLMPSPRGKGISIGDDSFGGDNLTIPRLQKEISVLSQKNIELEIRVSDLQVENTKRKGQGAKRQADKSRLSVQVAHLLKDKVLKSKQISDLQDHFNLLTSSYFEKKKKLEEDLGDKYQTSADEYKINLHAQSFPVTMPTGQTSGVVDRVEDEPP